MKQPKLYYFFSGSHHHLISAIDKNNYGIFDFCTNRYTEDRWKTLDEALEGAKKYYKESGYREFETYRDFARHLLDIEREYDYMDLWDEKNLIERESLQDGEKLRKKLGIK